MIYKITDGVFTPVNLREHFPNTSFCKDLSKAILPDGYIWARSAEPPSPKDFETVVLGDPIYLEDECVWQQTWEIIPWTDEQMQAFRSSLRCGPLQLRKALRQLGLYDEVETAINNLGGEALEAWSVAATIRRLDPVVLQLQSIIDKSENEVDDIFILARSL